MNLHLSLPKNLRLLLAAGLLAGSTVACSGQDESDGDANADDGAGADDGSPNTGGSASSGNTGGGANGEGGGSTTGSKSRCPDYTALNHGIGSWFQYGYARDGITYGLRNTVKAVREESDGTYVIVAAKSDWQNTNASSTTDTTSTFVCDERGARLLKAESSTTMTIATGPTTSHSSLDYGDGALSMVWDAGPGESWTSAFTVTITTGSNTTVSDQQYRYKMLEKQSATTPAGSFDGVEVETTTTIGTAAPTTSRGQIYEPELGLVSSEYYVLQAYEIK